MLVLAAAVVAACGPKGPQAGQASADSTASNFGLDAATMTDSSGLAPSADSTSLAAPGAVRASGSGTVSSRDSTLSKATGTTPRGGEYLGRDSAFGPTFTVDSTGKVTPIVPVKKKP